MLKEITNENTGVSFGGLHCKDCIMWEPDPKGGGKCYFRPGIVWPGSEICEEFKQ